MKRSAVVREERIKALLACAEANGVAVQRYAPGHFRLFGKTVVDYWPMRSRCWITGSNSKSAVLPPEEVVKLAGTPPELDMEALKHMKSIMEEETQGGLFS